jgi:hypothetical protein
VRNLQLYATGSATGTSVAQVTIPASTKIRGAHVNLACNTITDDAQVRIELSKVPTNQIAVNGALDPFLEFGIYQNFVTSGMSAPGVPLLFVPLDVDCRQGEIIYLHATVSGTVVYFCTIILSYAWNGPERTICSISQAA